MYVRDNCSIFWLLRKRDNSGAIVLSSAITYDLMVCLGGLTLCLICGFLTLGSQKISCCIVLSLVGEEASFTLSSSQYYKQ